MGQYDDLQARQDQLIRKTLEGSVFIAPYTADAIATLTTGSDAELAALPTGYEDAGWIDAGATISEGISTTDIAVWGSVEPARSDITKRSTSVKVAMQETKLTTIGVYTGTDTSAISADPTTGEVSVAQAIIPAKVYYRLLVLGVDLSEDGEIYIARFLPRVSVTNVDDQPYENAANAQEWGVTFTATPDPTLGYASRYLFGGPGWKALLVDMELAHVIELEALTSLAADSSLTTGGLIVV